MAAIVAVYDACVLHAEPLRDFMVQLTLSDHVRVHWSERIHEEWQRSVRRRNPELDPAKLERTRKLMDAANPDGLVEGFEPLIDTLTLPDPDDRHVLAAAIKMHAECIVTANLKDFPKEKLEPYGITAMHPDDFVMCIYAASPNEVYLAAKLCRGRRRKPPSTPEEYVDLLEQQGLVSTAEILREAIDLI